MKNINKNFFGPREIPIDKFISNVLYDKNYGYYSKKIPFGKNGDFITAPEISFLFSEIIAIWIISFWQHLRKPKSFNVVELGPGNGQLNRIMMKTFRKFPKFFNSSNIYLYEKSKKLEKIQKKLLDQKKTKWIRNFNEIKKGPIIFFGNEFFDAIPIKQYEVKKNTVYERFIKLNKDRQIEYLLKKINKKINKQLKELDLLKNQNFIEYPKQGLDELKKITKVIKKHSGGILLIDYGFLKQKSIDTIQSVKKHKKNKLFDNLGNADITSLVNFNLLEKYFKKEKLRVNNTATQGEFLKRMGIINRANIISRKMSFKDKSSTYFNLQRLLDPKYMGDLFKVIFAFKNKKKFSLGFD
jgi:cyclopropane-fatty-acyl-phospholipid synthase